MHAEESQGASAGIPSSMELILLLLGFICFVVAAASVSVGRVNLIALGLAFWIAVPLFGAIAAA